MEEGISIDKACAINSAGTKEDFERRCNPDGTVKKHTETTTFYQKNSDNTVTINNTYLQISLAVAVVIILALAVLVIRKLKRKTR